MVTLEGNIGNKSSTIKLKIIILEGKIEVIRVNSELVLKVLRIKQTIYKGKIAIKILARKIKSKLKWKIRYSGEEKTARQVWR